MPECPDIYVYTTNSEMVAALFGKDKIHTFGNAAEVATADMIINEKATDAARKQHRFYADKYGGEPWEKLSAFIRYSNISSADFLFVIKRLVEKKVPFKTITELEHIRRCRYYYINNRTYGEKCDDNKRIHNCLIPFSELSEAEIDKDIEAIKSKLLPL